MRTEVMSYRADIYAFLSRMFAEEPPRQLIEDLAAKRFSIPGISRDKELEEGLELIEKCISKYGKEIYESLCIEYTRLFIGPVPVVFPYESMYKNGSMMSGSLLSVKREYRLAGLEKAPGFHEPEDHIAVELGFMKHLCRDQSEKSLRMQRDFLNNHLLKWVPEFCDEVCEKSMSHFYKGIAKLTKGFIALEKDALYELPEDKDYIIKKSSDIE